MFELSRFSRAAIAALSSFAIAASLAFGAGASALFSTPAYASPEGHTIVIAGSDFQQGSDAGSAAIVKGCLNAMKKDGIAEPDGLVMPGDYNRGEVDTPTSNASIAALKAAVLDVYPSIGQNMVLSAGNHELNVAEGINVSPYGANDQDGYGVFVIHEDNFPSQYGNGDASRIDYEGLTYQTSVDLMNYLNEKIKAQYSKPIFVLCHVPLHVTIRSNCMDGRYGKMLLNVMNQGAAAGLNIVFLYGHYHNSEAEDFHGGGSVFYEPGQGELCVYKNMEGNRLDSTKEYQPVGFYYMNAGYTGYFGGSSGVDDALTMTAFDITDTSMTIVRYSKDGMHNLKSEGVPGSRPEGVEVVPGVITSPQTFELQTVTNPNRLITKVRDSDIAVESVALNYEKLTLEPGESDALTAKVLPAAATNKTIAWTSSDQRVATVDSEGHVTAVSAGTATITATAASGVSAACQVKVLSDAEIIRVTGISVSESQITLRAGGAKQLSAALTPANATKDGIKWTSSNEEVATVSASGKVTAVGVGTANVTATAVDGGLTATCKVTVEPTPVEGVAISKHELAVSKGKTASLTATVSPAGATDKTVVWSSSNEAVAKVSAEGVVTGIGDGQAIISAKTADGGFVDTCVVTVRTEGAYFTPSKLIIPQGESHVVHADVYPADDTVLFSWFAWSGSATLSGTDNYSRTLYAKSDTQGAEHSITIQYRFSGNGVERWGGQVSFPYMVVPRSDVSWVVADGVLIVKSDVPDYASASAAPWAKYADQITAIKVKEGVASVGANAFSSCANASEITYTNGLNLDKDALKGLDNIVVNGKPAHDCAADGHVEVKDAAKAATCTEAGLTEGAHCSVCNAAIKAQEAVAAKGHTEVKDAAKPATCTETGLKEGVHCSVCNEIIKAQETISAKGHTEVKDAAKAATCTESGLTEGSHCSACNAVLKAQQTAAAKGHEWSKWTTVIEPAVGVDGLKLRACKNCDATENETIPALKPSTDPENPGTDPGNPDVDPENPTNPSDPTNPDAPAQPTNPTNPTDPTKPTDPADSGKPSIPSTPAVDPAPQLPEGAVGTDKEVSAAIVGSNSDEIGFGVPFAQLRAKAAKITKSSIKVSWIRVPGASKYLVYGNKCGKGKKYQLLKTTTSRSFTKKKLKKNTYYKFLVMAVDSKGNVLSVAKTIHVATKGGKYKNAIKVKTAAKKNKVTLKKGKSFKLRASAVVSYGSGKAKKHRVVKYEASKKSVATVTSKGVIKAKKRGACYVYAYAQNGVYAKVKVTVK